MPTTKSLQDFTGNFEPTARQAIHTICFTLNTAARKPALTHTGLFATLMETPFLYRDRAFRLRTIIRLMVESFVRAVTSGDTFHPFLLHARDAGV